MSEETVGMVGKQMLSTINKMESMKGEHEITRIDYQNGEHEQNLITNQFTAPRFC